MRRDPGSGPHGSGTRAGLNTSGGLRRKSVRNPVPDVAFPGFQAGGEDFRRTPDVTGRDVPQRQGVYV